MCLQYIYFGDYPQNVLNMKIASDEIPAVGLCFAGGIPVMVKQAKNKTLFERSEFCFVQAASHRRVAEKFSLDFLVLLYQDKRTKK